MIQPSLVYTYGNPSGKVKKFKDYGMGVRSRSSEPWVKEVIFLWELAPSQLLYNAGKVQRIKNKNKPLVVCNSKLFISSNPRAVTRTGTLMLSQKL